MSIYDMSVAQGYLNIEILQIWLDISFTRPPQGRELKNVIE